MDLPTVLQLFHDSAYGSAVREIFWLFPALEIVHFISLCVLFGAVLFIDLRLLGIGRHVPIAVALRFIPVAIVAFVFSLLSGLGFFCNSPMDYWPNPSFRLKLLLLLLAGANALWFEFSERRSVTALPAGSETPLGTRISAAVSLSAWLLIIILGRLLPYTGTSA